MTGWRETKRKALAIVHKTFEIPAVYLTHAAGTPVPVLVRLHTKPVISDQQAGDWSEAPSFADMTNRIIFRADQVNPVLPRSYVIFSPTEAYRTGPAKPWREGYIWVEVIEVDPADLTAFLATVDTSGAAWEGVIP